jgi:hypothetical protein
LLDDFAGAYGAEPATLWAEVLHQLRLRLGSIGFSDVGREGGIILRPWRPQLGGAADPERL